jgi:putative PIN family toxin of toxin-antitoxin system
MVKTKASLDTNILISAFGWKGPPNRVFEEIVNGNVELIISDAQFNELTEVLDYPKFQRLL